MPFLAIPTSNRAQLLRRCIESIARATRSGLTDTPRVVIADGGLSAEAVNATAAVVAFGKRELGLTIQHVASNEKRIMHDRMLTCTRSRCRSSAFAHAINGHMELQSISPGCGSNRNTTLLLSAGQPLLSVDDDAAVDFALLRNGDQEATRDLYFSLESEFRYLMSPVDELARLDSLTQPDSRKQAGTIMAELQAAISQSNTFQRQVRLATTGIRGNRWYRDPGVNLRASGPVREEVFRKRRRYHRARKSGLAILGSGRPIVTGTVSFVTCCCAIDNRELLPPFPNAGRQSDTVFSWLVKRMYPNQLTAHLPFAIHHSTDIPRPFSEEDYHVTDADLGAINVAIVKDLAGKALPNHADEALVATGCDIIALSRMCHKQWLDYTHSLWLAHSGSLISSLEELLDRYNERPSYWAKDVHEYIVRLRAQNVEPTLAIPRELKAIYTQEQATALHRYFLRDYGELMTLWPEIWRTAKSINENNEWGVVD